MAARITIQDHEHPTVPRPALIGAGLLVFVTLVLASISRWTDIGATRVPDARVVVSVDLRFTDRADGAIVVSRAEDGRTVSVIAPGTNGFTRGALRGLARERRRTNGDLMPPFRMTRWSDGRMSLADPVTGRRIELDVFGPTNAAAFAQILSAATTP